MGKHKSRQPGSSGRTKGTGRSIRHEAYEAEDRPQPSGEPPPAIHLRQLRAAQAIEKLEMQLFLLQRRGAREVLVVHGKGLRSQGEPVIAPLVQDWLRAHPDIVASWRPAPRDWGGEGALVVALRKVAS